MSRLLSGITLAAVFFAIIWFGSAWVLLAVAIGVCVLVFTEYAELMDRIGADIPKLATLVATLAALTAVPFPYVAIEGLLGVALVVIAVSAMTGASPARSDKRTAPEQEIPLVAGPGFSRALSGAAAGILSVIYLGLPLGALVGTHILGGRGAVLLLVFTIVVSDTAQYYSGRLFGRHALARRLSPKKTIEGAIGGFVTAPIFLYFAGPYFVPVASPLIIAALAIPLVAAGIAGDLFESMLKRTANVKDTSALIPGHGGALDRIDALLFATPVFYLYVRWLYTM